MEAVPVRGAPRIQNRTTDHGQVRFLLPCALRLRARRRDGGRVAGLVPGAGVGAGGLLPPGGRLHLLRVSTGLPLPLGPLPRCAPPRHALHPLPVLTLPPPPRPL